jgi:hypothetical protein
MQTINNLSDHVDVEVVFSGLDIGNTSTDAIATGTDAELHWTDMTYYGNLLFVGQLGTATESDWTAGDDVLTITVQQATSSIGAGAATVEAYTVTAGDLDAKGNRFAIEVPADKLNRASGMTHMRVKVAATDNTGVIELNGVYVKYNARFSDRAKDSWTKQFPYDQAPN